jgi:hypothetical protein
MGDYVVCLVNINGSIVRSERFNNRKEAFWKVDLWKKLFPKNSITLDNILIYRGKE